MNEDGHANSLLRFLLGVLFVAGLACTAEEPAPLPIRSAQESPPPIRLLDALSAEAVVAFPDVEPPVADGLEVIALQDMEWALPDYRGENAENPLPVSGGVTTDTHHVASPGLWIEASEPTPACLVSAWVRVLPNTSYSVMGYVRTEDLVSSSTLHGAFLLEALSEQGIERYRVGGNHKGTSADWALETLSIQTGPQTDQLHLLACLSAPGGGTGRAWFDDTAIVRTNGEPFTPEMAQRIAETRLSFRWRHDVAAANRLDLGHDASWGSDLAIEPFRRKVELGEDVRNALLAPPPSVYTFTVATEGPARFRTALGTANPGGLALPGSVTFRVSFQREGEDPGVLLERTIPFTPEETERWHPVEVALPSGPGQLQLSTTATPGLELAAAAFANPTLLRGDPQRKRRQVLLISLDTLRADALGSYGAVHPASPNLDALAARGVLFEQAHAPSPWTLPSHRTMLTGLAPLSHGSVIGERHVLRPEITTLGEILQGEGFRTVGIHGGGFVAPAYGFAEGFDRYVQIGEPEDAVDEALRVVGDSDGQDLFLFFHNYQAHDPYRAYESQLEELGPRYLELRDQLADVIAPDELGAHDFLSLHNESGTPLPAAQREMLWLLYQAGVRRIDDELGRLFDAMARDGTLDDTIIIVTSDHGDGFEEHGALLHGNSLYTELLHVPLLVVQPRDVPAGVRVSAHVGTADVAPTLLELLGLDAPADLDGRSLVSTWQDSGSFLSRLFSRWLADEPPPVGASLVQQQGVLLSSLDAGSKYILNSLALKEELYDVRADPGEQRDLAKSSPEDLQHHRRQLASRIAKLPGLHLVVQGDPDAPTRVLTGTIGADPGAPMRVLYLPCDACGLEADDGSMRLGFPLASKPLWLNLPAVRELDDVPIQLQLDGQPLELQSREEMLAGDLRPGAYAFVTEALEAAPTALSQERLKQLEALGYLD